MGRRRTLRNGALTIGGFVAFVLLADAAIGLFQPALDAEGAEGVLWTTDDEGNAHDTRLAVVEDEAGVIWIQSGHYFRGWYERALRHPEVELVRHEVRRPFTAVPVDTAEARSHVSQLLQERVGVVGFYAIRTTLLFAKMRPVRLDPR